MSDKKTDKAVEKSVKKNESEKSERVKETKKSDNAKPEKSESNKDSGKPEEKQAEKSAEQSAPKEGNLSESQAKENIEQATMEANGGATPPNEPPVIEESTRSPEISNVETNKDGDIESNADQPVPKEVADLIEKQDATRTGNDQIKSDDGQDSMPNDKRNTEFEADIDRKLDAKFPNAGEKKNVDERLDARFPNAPDDSKANNEFRSAQQVDLADTADSRLRSALREQGVIVVGGESAVAAAVKFIGQHGVIVVDNTERGELPDGVRRLLNGTSIKTVDGSEIVLASDALVRFDGNEQTFAGTLSNWKMANVRLNAGEMRLKYDPNGSLLPLSAQTSPEDMTRFIASLDLHEAMHLGISRETYFAARENSDTHR